MCVFLSIKIDKAQIKKIFDISHVDEEFFGPVYVQSAFEFGKWPVITSEQPDHLQMMNWGLIPHWIKDEDSAAKIRANTVNARIETVTEKPSFRQAVSSTRCIVVADGFYEFREVNKTKYPYHIQVRGGDAFPMAGIYDKWMNHETGELISSFSIITTTANELMTKIHNRKKRMPVILSKELGIAWLNKEIEPAEIASPFPSDKLEAWTVSRLLTNRSENKNVPEVYSKFEYPELGLIDSFNL